MRQCLSISVPAELRQQLKALPDINWSGVAQEAFTAKLRQLQQPGGAYADAAEAAYCRYCQAVGWRSVNGQPLPDWSSLCRAKPQIAQAWAEAAQAAIEHRLRLVTYTKDLMNLLGPIVI